MASGEVPARPGSSSRARSWVSIWEAMGTLRVATWCWGPGREGRPPGRGDQCGWIRVFTRSEMGGHRGRGREKGCLLPCRGET